MVAEGAGFEPAGLLTRQFSRLLHSAALSPFPVVPIVGPYTGAGRELRLENAGGDDVVANKLARLALVAPDGRVVAILVEAHLKLERAALAGKAVVDTFSVRGVEGIQKERLFLGKLLSVLINGPGKMIQLLNLDRIRTHLGRLGTISSAPRLRWARVEMRWAPSESRWVGGN